MATTPTTVTKTAATQPCPACNRPLFNRQFDHCMWCGVDLPVSLQLSAEEKAVAIERDLQIAKERAEAERSPRRALGADSGGGDLGGFDFGGGDGGGGGGCGSGCGSG